MENAGWRMDPDNGFVGHVGGLWHRDVDGIHQLAFIAREIHANRNGLVHGGMLMTFIDRAFGQVARLTTTATQSTTVSLNHQFLAPVRIGDLVKVTPAVQKVTPRMVFLAATAFVGNAPVISSQGVFRISNHRITEGLA